MSKKELTKRYALFLLSVLINGFGIAVITFAHVGTTPISSSNYVLSLHCGLTLGQFTFLFNVLLIISQYLMLNKQERKEQIWNIILQVPITVPFCLAIDLGMTVLHSLLPTDLAYIFKTYGEERFAGKVANAIVRQREKAPFTTTLALADVISASIPGKPGPKHKATRCFQALRIAVNSELDELKSALEGSLDVLDKDGRLCVISFHSLEDRIVKTFIRENSEGPKLPRGLPITDEELAELKLKSCTLQKISGAIKATDAEISQNPRSRSAVLRVAARLGRSL